MQSYVVKVPAYASSSVQSLISHEEASSSMTSFSVENTIFSYISRAAARACWCQGPVLPAWASSSLRQMPGMTLVRYSSNF